MRTDEEQMADTSYGCEPFGRLTLLPSVLWQHQQANRLIDALRPLLSKSTAACLVIDCGLLTHEANALALFHFLFNLDYQLQDLGLKTRDDDRKLVRVSRLIFCCQVQQQAHFSALLRQAYAGAKGMNIARRLADMPSDCCTPAYVASEVKTLISDYPSLSCEVLDEIQIQQHGLGLLHAVGKGGNNPPRLVVIRYAGKEKVPFAAYVGKGITFDTGGHWLKSGDGMYTMKYDMCGAANVLGLLVAAAELQLARPVVGVLALAENMIGPAAMRPGDVAMSYAGYSVEINNTDAEGRLVLADGIAWASRMIVNGQPARYVIDLATLTGAVVKALGYELSGLMTQDENLRHALTLAGQRCADEVWSLPLDARFDGQIKSHIADYCNTPTNNAAISTSAAWFLSRFCPDNTPWAHLDISGTALWREKGYSVASGRPVPLLVQHLLEDMEN
nr:leucyl aminopeptidase family protein [Izhakiella capsodis]